MLPWTTILVRFSAQSYRIDYRQTWLSAPRHGRHKQSLVLSYGDKVSFCRPVKKINTKHWILCCRMVFDCHPDSSPDGVVKADVQAECCTRKCTKASPGVLGWGDVLLSQISRSPCIALPRVCTCKHGRHTSFPAAAAHGPILFEITEIVCKIRKSCRRSYLLHSPKHHKNWDSIGMQ